MERYDYRREMYDDVRAYLEENADDYKGCVVTDRFKENLRDVLWTTDSVTGNGSGSYTFNAWQAEENICHNGDLIDEMCSEFGINNIHKKGAEEIDVCIRCYLLPQVIDEVVTALDDEGWFDGEESDEEDE